MVGIHVEQPQLMKMAGVMGYKIGVWPLKYLGMPLQESKSNCFLGPSSREGL